MSIASISGATASRAGDARSGTFRGAGTGDASASRTVRRCTPCSGRSPGPPSPAGDPPGSQRTVPPCPVPSALRERETAECDHYPRRRTTCPATSLRPPSPSHRPVPGPLRSLTSTEHQAVPGPDGDLTSAPGSPGLLRRTLLPDQQQCVIPAQVPRAGHCACGRAGDPRPLRPATVTLSRTPPLSAHPPFLIHPAWLISNRGRTPGDGRPVQRHTSSRNPRPGRPVRGCPWKADGAHRPSWRPDAVRYMSVDTATQRSTAIQGDT
jgi:hypothetical protein